MTLNEVRAKYLEFFKARGHVIIPSAPLVPENDPTTLFTGSGMQPLVPYLLGQPHPSGTRLADSQKSFRSMDIEEVGDNRHTTFFEMLGNWSLGDYFKKEQLSWFYEFLTKEIDIPAEKLWVSCFEGDPKNNIPKDTESAEIWKSLGIPAERIFFYGSKNWWTRAGTADQMPAGEPGGPDSEVFYDFGTEHDLAFGPECHPNCDCGRFLEIGNSVFMQYIKKEDGTFGLLPKQNVDFGGGLERIAAVSENSNDIFTVAHASIIKQLEQASGKKYTENLRAFRIIADHVKAAVFLIADGVRPDNKDQGYFVRRLLRRAVLFLHRLHPDMALASVIPGIVEEYKSQYPELAAKQVEIEQQVSAEEAKFIATLARGTKELERFTKNGSVSAQDAFQLVTTYGFPLELILEEAGERGIKQVDIEEFKELLKAHQDLSRAGSEQKFKGGLADTSEQTIRLHTAHHLLLKALQIVLGSEVHQRGSNITAERLRIDFNYGSKMTLEQKAEVERIVNEKIQEDLPVVRTEMSLDDAEKLHAEHEFGAKYPERVSVYSVGPLNSAFSIEFCGGPHVEHTGELKESGVFKIQKEEAVAQGIRRIKAVLE
ncbi:MAG TPA: alanine--tRNA ligase [Candidatus Paceibacterota bacterium]